MQKLTLKKIAQELDVSISTVSKALRDSPEISDDTRQKVKAFATLYTEAADAIRAAQNGEARETVMGKLPGLAAGLEGMAFIRACVASSKDDAAWVTI